jgi:hypothetical protein
VGRGRIPFARVGADTNRAALTCGVYSIPAAVFNVLLERARLDGSGNVVVSTPRAEIAEALGVPEYAVSKAVQALVARGAIRMEHKAYRGTTATYRVLLPCGCVKGDPHRVSIGAPNGNPPRTQH